MAKKRLKLKDKQGNVIDYDISAASVTIDAEGKSVDVKLAELVAAIAETVISVTFNGEPHNIYNRRIDLGNQMQPDWEESSPTYPSYVRNKPNVVTGIKVGEGGSTLTPDHGVVTLPESGGQVECDTEMSPTSENAVQNKVVKAYVDAVSARIDTLIGSGNVQGAIDTFNEVTAFLAGISSSDTLAAKLAQIQQSIPDVSGFVTESEMESAIDDAVDGLGSVESVTVNGTTYTPDSQGDVDLGTITGAKGDKGDKGDTVVLDPSQVEQFDIINGLNAQSAGDALDAYQGAQLKAKINEVYTRLKAVYSALGNIAFWDGKPAASTILPDLDWGLPKHTVTLDLTLTNAVVKHNGTAVADGDTIQVEEYSTLVLTIEAEGGYTLSSVASTAGDVSQDMQTITLVMGQSDVTLDITASAVQTYSISYGTMANCSVAQGAPTSIMGGGEATIVFSIESGYALYRTGISVQGASIKSFADDTLVIENATGNVTISATAETPKVKFLKGYRLIASNGTTQLSNAPFYKNGDSTQENITPISAVSEYLHVPQNASATSILFTVLWGYTAGVDTSTVQWACYSKDETTGEYTCLAYRGWDKAYNSKSDRGPDTSGSPSPMSQVCAALQAGTLYVRSTITLDPDTNYAALRKSANGAYGIGYKINSGSLTELFYPRENGGVPTNHIIVNPEDWDVDDLNLS